MKLAKEKIINNFIFCIILMCACTIFCITVMADETTGANIAETTTGTTEGETTTLVEPVTPEETTSVINNGKYSISNTQLELVKGQKYQLEVYNLPQENGTVKWSTSNKFAVKVSDNGLITAKNYGVATITAKCKKKTVTCMVTVRDTSRSVVLTEKQAVINEGQTVQLQVVSPNTVTYISKNEAIAIVDENGLVTGLNPGKTEIIAKSTTGYDTFSIKVKDVVKEKKAIGKIGDPAYKRIRRCTKKGKVYYDKIVRSTGKTIYFKLDGIDESKVKKCKWTTGDKTLLTKPQKINGKIKAKAQTLNIAGVTKVTATVTMKNGKKKIFNSYVYITSPVVNTNQLVLLGKNAGKNRQQYITLEGLNDYSTIEWIVPENGTIKVSKYEDKLSVKGMSQGNGLIKVKVDGKTFKIKYQVYPFSEGTIKSVFSVGKVKKINISGVENIVPTYSSRNEQIATVSDNGEVTGISSGVTYIDVKLGNMHFSYRVEIAAEGMMKIIKRGKYIINNWTYSQANRLQKGYYDCSALVWKSYKEYNNYHLLIGGEDWAYSAGDLFDYLESKNQIIYYGYLTMDDLKPGDIIFYGDYDMAVQYSTPGRTLDIYHASLYVGNGELVELTGNHIEGNSMKYIVGIGRVVN